MCSLRTVLFFFLTISSAASFSFDYTKGLSDEVFPISIPEELPEAGVTYKDPTFGTDITRITNIRKRNPKSSAPGIVNEYARFDPQNADGTLAIFRGTDATWYLYDMTKLKSKGRILRQGRYEPRWHATDPDIFFYIDENKFYKYDARKRKRTLLYNARKDYKKASWITTQGDGDSSSDSRYWAFMVVNYSSSSMTELDRIIFDAEKSEVIARYMDTPNAKITDAYNVSMSMTGEYIVVESVPAQVFNRDWSNGRTLPGVHGHGDLALSKDGRDVLVTQDNSTDYVTMVYLDTLEEVNLMFIPFQTPAEGGVSYQGFHFSGNSVATPGWVLVSTYGYSDTASYWSDGTLFLLELKENGRHFRIAHTNAKTTKDGNKDYWAEAFATIDRQGKYVFWGTNWGITGKDYADVYRVTLPDGWFEELGD